MPLTRIFSEIYARATWGRRCLSGDGSTAEAVAPLQEALPRLLSTVGAVSILDAGCGISPWLEELLPWFVLRYVGLDVVPLVIETRTRSAKPGSAFRLHNIALAPADTCVDLAVCRDVLTHLPDRDALQAIRHLRESSRFLLTTHWPQVGRQRDIEAGKWRPLNLTLGPFLLPAPKTLLAEIDAGKTLALFDLEGWESTGK